MADNRGKAAFFSDDDFEVKETVQDVREVQEESTTGTTSTIEFGATQGRKGHKAPRINMAFSPDNHAWIKTRSRQLGMSATEFVNSILDQERLKG